MPRTRSTRRTSPWSRNRLPTPWKRCACGQDIGFEFTRCHACTRREYEARERARALPAGAQLELIHE